MAINGEFVKVYGQMDCFLHLVTHRRTYIRAFVDFTIADELDFVRLINDKASHGKKFLAQHLIHSGNVLTEHNLKLLEEKRQV